MIRHSGTNPARPRTPWSSLLACALVVLVGCREPETPPALPCSNATNCLPLLCNPESTAEELTYAAVVMADMALPSDGDLTAQWSRCARSALSAASTHDTPKGCGPPRFTANTFSPWDLAGLGYFRESDFAKLRFACAPRGAFLIAGARRWASDESVRDVLHVAMNNRHQWIARVARRGLLAVADDTALSLVVRDLKSPDAAVRANAVDDFAVAGRAAQPYVLALLAAGSTLEPTDRRTLVPAALSRIGGEEAGRALAAQLNDPSFHADKVLEACTRLGPDAAAAAPGLFRFARNHPFKHVREMASGAYESVTGEFVNPGRGQCPSDVRREGAPWVVTLTKRKVVLADIGVGHPDAARCSKWPEANEATTAMAAGDACLFGINHGEWGGVVVARRMSTGTRQVVDSTNPLLFIDDGRGGTLLIAGIAHMMVAGGWVDRLRRRVDGTWVSDPIATLPGFPAAYRHEGDSLLILLHGSEPGCRGNRYVLVRVNLDGRIDALD